MTENQIESVVRLHEFSSKAEEIIRQLRAAIEAAPCEETCDSVQKFIHEPPCEFKEAKYCLAELRWAISAISAGLCPPSKPGDVRCHPASCICVWKSAALAIGATE